MPCGRFGGGGMCPFCPPLGSGTVLTRNIATLTGRSVSLLFDSTKKLPSIKPSVPVSAYGHIRPNSDPRS